MRRAILQLLLAAVFFTAAVSRAASSVAWDVAHDRVTADVQKQPLFQMLEDVAHQTGWHIFVEPEAARLVDVKFKNLPGGEALHKLLGTLNFAFVPMTNEASQLYVFLTAQGNATKALGTPVVAKLSKPAYVTNELIVKLKPGANIDAIAKSVGARIIGRDDALGIYRLQFDSTADMEAALAKLKTNDAVTAVEHNYYYDAPPAPQQVANAPVGPPKLVFDRPTDGDPCNPIIGLVDTQVQALGNGLDQFLMKPVSVVGDVTPVTGTITHGSAMAVTMANALSQSSGGHTSARILPVNVYRTGDSTTTYDLLQGVLVAATNGASVINISSGGTDYSPILDSVFQQMTSQGIVIFASAGNTPVNTKTYPAAYPGVNAVTALGAPGQLASYANYGNFVEMALPGTSIVYIGSQGYVVQGTSPAAAYASGIAAGTKTVNCAGWPQIVAAMAQKFPVPAK